MSTKKKSKMKAAKCEKVNAMKVAREQKHLNEEQQVLSGKVLNEFSKLFDGTL